jgi:hypothetical protein
LAILAGSAPSDTSGYGKIYVNSSNNKLYFKDGSGGTFNLTNGAVASSAGGSSTNFQFNDGGSFGGNGALSFTKASKTLSMSANTTFTVDSSATLNLNSNNISIADNDIQLTGASTTITQTTGAITIKPANNQNLNVDLNGTGDFVVDTNKLVVDNNGNTAIGKTASSAKLEVNGSLALTPSNLINIAAGDSLTVTNSIIRIAGNGSPINLSSNPQIADGTNGQIIIIKGTSDINTVTFDDGDGLALTNAISVTLGNKDTLVLMYDAIDDLWIEISRSNK